GNLDAVQGMHPALRSRIRGYGYEIYMKATMLDTDENRLKLVRFVAQEVAKDRKIPHFDRTAVLEILREAQRRAGRRGQLTLRLRELGGLIRVAGDIAQEEATPLVTAKHVVDAKRIARSLEQQVADRMIERGKEYQTFITEGAIVGMVNGLAVLVGDNSIAEFSGIVLPIAAEVTPAQAKQGGRIIATGRLGEIAKEAVENVAALIKKYTGEDISNHDIHVQFVGSREGTAAASASISVATAVISGLEEAPVTQGVALTGSLSVRGQGLPAGGGPRNSEAAAERGRDSPWTMPSNRSSFRSRWPATSPTARFPRTSMTGGAFIARSSSRSSVPTAAISSGRTTSDRPRLLHRSVPAVPPRPSRHGKADPRVERRDHRRDRVGAVQSHGGEPVHGGRALRDDQEGARRGRHPQLPYCPHPGHPRAQRLGEPRDFPCPAFRHRVYELRPGRPPVSGTRPEGALAAPLGPGT